MTYSTTHVGISTLLFYFFAPKRIKTYLRNNPTTFFWISLGSIIPDLDILTRGHRAYGHSILFPLILILAAPYLVKLREHDEFFKRKLQLFGLMWITHLIYDTTFGPIALFFPIDPRFYDIRMGIILDMDGFLFLAVFIGGFFISINPIDQTTGTNTFFINWTQEQRIQTFGETVNFPISDFMTHVTIFFFYAYLVLLPLFRHLLHKLSLKYPALSDFKESSTGVFEKYQINTTTLFTPFILLLLTSSLFIAGPMDGKQWVDTSKQDSHLWVTTRDLQLVGNLYLKVPKNSQMEVYVKPENTTFEMDLFISAIDEAEFSKIREKITNLLDRYENQTITFTNLVLSYQDFIRQNTTISSQSIKMIGMNSTTNWHFSSTTDLRLLIGLFDWNITESFMITLSSSITWYIDRTFSFVVGTILFVLSLSMTVVAVGKTITKVQKGI